MLVNTVAVVFTILASAVVVMGGLFALSRAIFRAALDLRDNKNATIKNTAAIVELSTKMDGRITALEERMTEVERNQGRD
jgi:hypothetical protein